MSGRWRDDTQSKTYCCDINRNGGTMKKYAVVTQTNPLRIKFDGEETASDNLYNRLGSYNPRNGDRVVVDVEDGRYLILGKVVK